MDCVCDTVQFMEWHIDTSSFSTVHNAMRYRTKLAENQN